MMITTCLIRWIGSNDSGSVGDGDQVLRSVCVNTVRSFRLPV